MTAAKVTIEIDGMQAGFLIPDVAAARMEWPLDVVPLENGRSVLGDICHLQIIADLPRSAFSGWKDVPGHG